MTTQSLPGAKGSVAQRLRTKSRSLLAPSNIQGAVFSATMVFSLIAAVYWILIASDRYVSEAHVVIERTTLTSGDPTMAFGVVAVVPGLTSDQMLLRDHLLSIDMLKALDAKLDLRAHYSYWRRDPLSSLWFKNAPIEKFREYVQDRVTVEVDEFTGILTVKSQAYDPETAQAITAMLVEAGERHMNAMAHALAAEQVAFLESQVKDLNERAIAARQALLTFQNSKQMLSPAGTAQTVEMIIAKLEGELSDLQTRRNGLLGYLMPDSPGVRELDLQIAGTREQIGRERKRLASPDGDTLNRAVDQYQTLEMKAQFAQDLYKSAITALEIGRVEATRTLKKVSVLQSPNLPEYALEPRRLYNSLVYLIVSLLLAGLLNLIIIIIRDHRD
jgi:capsular polysaccharide transport system permease protein